MWKLVTIFNLLVVGADVQPRLDPISTQEVYTYSIKFQQILPDYSSMGPQLESGYPGYKVYWGFMSRSYYGSLYAGSSTAVKIPGFSGKDVLFLRHRVWQGRIGKPLFERSLGTYMDYRPGWIIELGGVR
jgi:hypothetical protein